MWKNITQMVTKLQQNIRQLMFGADGELYIFQRLRSFKELNRSLAEINNFYLNQRTVNAE